MAYKIEKVVTPEKVVLQDGRQGYFINTPVATGAVVVIKYPSTNPLKRKPTIENYLHKKNKPFF